MSTVVRRVAEFAGFALLLFITRFVARAHLVQQMDQECFIGGIAAEVLAHGIRFPLLVYAPNEYDNGSFFSGLLAAVSFTLLGRNVLALKLVTHLISATGAVATLSLLRDALTEMGVTGRRIRWIATTVLVVALALAPRPVTIFSLIAVGNHAEGSAIDTILLALFSRRVHARARTAPVWVLVGFALYLNKGTFLVIPVLAVAEIALAWRSPRRLIAPLAGFILGTIPELLVIAQRYAMGWATMLVKGERNAQGFPYAFFRTLLLLGEYRVELLAAWGFSLAAGVAWFVRSRRQPRSAKARGIPEFSAPLTGGRRFTLGIVTAVSLLHLILLSVMARSGLDAYVIYGYPGISILFSLLVAQVCASARARWGERTEIWAGIGAFLITLVLYRPDALTWGLPKVTALWRNHAGAACSWRFAEGFEREYDYRLAALGPSREQHAIQRCRSLSEADQILDCIGGIARELHWRHQGNVDGTPPAELSAAERRAYAYDYGTHRKGKSDACSDFRSPDLMAMCAGAVQTECLLYGDIYTRLVSAEWLARPRCPLVEPPMNGFWAATRLDLLTRTGGTRANAELAWGDDDLRNCKPVFDECY